MTNIVKLIAEGRKTKALIALEAGCAADGFRNPRKGGYYRDFNYLEGLACLGWLEKRAAGPNGGIRYFATDKGKYIIDKCQE
jgi:hypothetical protein